MFETLELFAGIGGNSHGLRGWARPVQFVEICEDARKVLRRRHPGTPIHDDVRTFVPDRTYDLVTAGWPCTGFSAAGKREGFGNAASGLFSEVVRIVRLASPNLVFLENSHTLARPENFGVVEAAFDDMGYDLRSVRFRAFAVGALHGRHRWFGLAVKRGYAGPVLENGVEPFPWCLQDGTTTDADIPRQIPVHTKENRIALQLLGNSVVPDQVRLAFYKLYASSNDWSIPSSFGFATNFAPLTRRTYEPPLNIEVIVTDDSEPPSNATTKLPSFRGKYVIASWMTPVRNYGTHAYNNRITKRSLKQLTTRVHLAGPNDSVRRAISSVWVTWLMGYNFDV